MDRRGENKVKLEPWAAGDLKRWDREHGMPTGRKRNFPPEKTGVPQLSRRFGCLWLGGRSPLAVVIPRIQDSSDE